MAAPGRARAVATTTVADSAGIRALLDAMGVEDYEPRVVNQLVEFLYKYSTDVLLTAEAFSESKQPAGTVGSDEVTLAIQSRSVYNFVQPHSQEVLAEAAQSINAHELPRFPANKPGLLIPPEEDCLTAQNYQAAGGSGS